MARAASRTGTPQPAHSTAPFGARGRLARLSCLAGLLLACLSACAPATPLSVASPVPVATATAVPSQTSTPAPEPTITLTPSPLPSATATPGPRLCSPLAEVSLSELPGLIAGNTFETAMPGRDDTHPGIDLAFYRHGTRTTMLGLPIQAAMAGKVAASLPDRKPYGNLVIIEVPIENVPAAWRANLNWPAPAPTVVPDSRLTCPQTLTLPAWNTNARSLYLAYGHLNKPSALKVGDTVTCGQVIGEAGTTGASVNVHLHFEARLGPAGATFASMAHYDARSTEMERNNYCLWRVSNWFQLVDPLKILVQTP